MTVFLARNLTRKPMNEFQGDLLQELQDKIIFTLFAISSIAWVKKYWNSCINSFAINMKPLIGRGEKTTIALLG